MIAARSVRTRGERISHRPLLATYTYAPFVGKRVITALIVLRGDSIFRMRRTRALRFRSRRYRGRTYVFPGHRVASAVLGRSFPPSEGLQFEGCILCCVRMGTYLASEVLCSSLQPLKLRRPSGPEGI